jgi:hypothetical protein
VEVNPDPIGNDLSPPYLVEVNPDPVGNDLFTVLGGGERDRTDDLLRAKQALSQLSYTP